MSGRQDSNLRPSGPKPDALPPAPLPELGVKGHQQPATLAPPYFSKEQGNLAYTPGVGVAGLEPTNSIRGGSYSPLQLPLCDTPNLLVVRTGFEPVCEPSEDT